MSLETEVNTENQSTVNPAGSVMVVGAGIAGIQASLDLADSGYYVYLLEKKSAIGGVMAQLDKTFPTNDCSMCVISPKLVECGRHLNIELLTLSDIESVEGEAGNFKVKVNQAARFVDIDKCTSCGECAKVCPIDTPNMFDMGLRDNQAAFKLYPQGMPSAFAINKMGTAPCKSTCPAHVSIQGYVALINKGKYEEALKLFKQEHPFPGACGRFCHHPCESECTRNNVDQPLAIQYLHRFLSDVDFEQGPFIPEIEENREEKVAIIGAGPGGLSCAYFLALRGYKVTIFEKLPKPGGMMAVGIPEYRMPRDILSQEISVIESMGVEIKTGVEFGNDVTLDSLKSDGFKSVFMATGLHGSRRLGIEGEDLNGVLPGVDFLRDAALGNKVEIGKKVVVIGGGNVAVDVALTAKRVNSEAEVSLVCLEAENEMPAWDYEIEEAKEEGIEIVTCFGPQSFTGKDKVDSITFKRCSCVFDDNCNFNPQYDEDDLQTLDADTVIVAIGQSAVLDFADKQNIAVTNRGGLDADMDTFQTSLEWVFAGGDAVYGPKSVVEAVASGKVAAESIHRYINGLNLKEDRTKDWMFVKPETDDEEYKQRIEMKKLSVTDREGNFKEVAAGFSEDEAKAEADRCLKCGICSECYQCVDACLAGAIDHEMKPVTHEVEVGSIILAPGFTPFDPSKFDNYSYSKFPNVVTSLEFERILSASGPNEGHLIRPSDNKEPDKIAWLQCVGSRDNNRCDNGYCSSVCCMYANKQTVIAKEHSDKPLDTAIFFMDMRTHGKNFEQYYMRAEEEIGVRYERARIHSVESLEDDSLDLRYVDDEGNITNETFDMVVLSIGLAPNAESKELAEKLGIQLNHYDYADTKDLAPVSTSREGVYVCGVFQGPKDIPESVMEASASAAKATSMIAEGRGTMTKIKDLPPEIDVLDQEPRIGVFVCNCGINIGGVADVPAVRDYAATLPNVVHVEDNLFTCSQDTQDKMKEVIVDNNINRVVVASCSPRTHEPLFQETIREAGLNKYLFEMANIRDQNTWIHMDAPAKATAKAKDLVRMAVAKAALVLPLHQVALTVKQKVLVIGGGVAGMTAALGIAEQGFPAYLVESTDKLGGNALKLGSSWKQEAVTPFVEDLIEQVKNNPKIELFMESSISYVTGSIGNFVSRIKAADGQETEIEYGAAIMATGGKEYRPDEYQYGKNPNVMTHLEMDEAMTANDARVKDAGTAVFIQCVGSRTKERPYCSRICCTHSMKTAAKLKKAKPEMNVYILYRDIRTYGFREDLYKEARAAGVIFIRYDLENEPVVKSVNGDGLTVTALDHVLQKPVEIDADILVLATAVLPNENKELCEHFKIPTNADGFLVEAHAKLRPVDFASEGLFMAGLSHGPKSIEETIAQATASVSRTMTIVSKKAILVGGVVASVDSEKCAVCLTCVRTCPYSVPLVDYDGHAVIDPAKCHGCGACVAECPGKAISLQHFTDKQLLAKTDALFDTKN